MTSDQSDHRQMAPKGKIWDREKEKKEKNLRKESNKKMQEKKERKKY